MSLLAPHECLGCGQEGFVLCGPCAISELASPPSRCYRCHAATLQSRSCKTCFRSTGLVNLWVVAHYETLAKQVVHQFKFERAKAAASDIVREIDARLPILPAETVVIHVPTVPARIRRRGYDQSRLVARGIAAKRGYIYQGCLERVTKTRQVGAGRVDRFAQLKNAFVLKQSAMIEGKSILLVDDVVTTGATIEAVTRLLRRAGAKSVRAVVFAH